MGYNIGPKIGIDGEAEFRKQIKDINDTYKALEAETKAVTKQFEAQGDEQGKLEAVSKQLEKQIDQQKKKMSLLEDAVKKASEEFGENSIEATRLRGALYDTQATVSNLESELKDTRARLDQAGEAMEDFETSTEDAGQAALDFGDALGANLVSDIVMDGIRELAGLVKEFSVGSVEAAAVVKAANAQFEQTFGSFEKAASDALESISDDTDIASTRMQGSFTQLYAFSKNAGADVSMALTLSSRAMVAAADNAAYYDKSIEEATEQLQSFLKGNFENDAALGISATETTRNAKANQLYAKSFKELSEAQKVDVLLAMVEAGNEASGAIGQAARESDSWENVLGELAEVMRLIQANAGKPALKKLTPIIQKITKSGYELIEDIDWEEFGETVENIAEGVIDYGPAVVKTIASVAAGIVAFKAVQKAKEIYDFASSFITLAQSAQTAGTAMAASGAMAAATPWGLAATAISLVAAGLTALALNAGNAESELSKATDKLIESFEKAEQTYQDTKSEVDGAAYAAQFYIDRLLELETAGLNTAVAHREYEQIVEQLNELIPDLNLQIDEQTGLLTTNTSALKADITAWQQNATAKALQQKFTDVLDAQGKAQAELIDAQARLNTLLEEKTALDEELCSVGDEYLRVTEALRAAQDALASSYGLTAEEQAKLQQKVIDLTSEEYKLATQYEDMNTELEELGYRQEDLTADIEKASGVVESYADDIAQAEAATALFNQQIAESTQQQTLLTEAEQAVKASLESLIESYAAAEAAAMESINSQIGYFEELSMESEWSAEKIIKNWTDQQQAFSNYSANLQKAVEMNLDDALVQQLSDGSVESMQILNALVNDIDISVDEINDSFSKTEESRANMASVMAAIQTEVDSSLDEIIADAEQAGLDISSRAAKGVKSNSWKFSEEIKNMAQSGQDWWNKLWDRHSPSRWMGDASEDIVDGGANTIRDQMHKFEESMASMADAGQRAFLQEQLDLAVSYPDMVSSSTVSNTRNVTNYGGFTIQIYQQDGESAEDVAYRVMDIMQTEVAAKEAVFGGK